MNDNLSHNLKWAEKAERLSIANYFTIFSNSNVWKEINDVVDKLMDVRKRSSNIEFPSFNLRLEELENINVG